MKILGHQFKYVAFISYSSNDEAWGRKLQRKLEGYRMPSTLCRERGWARKPIRPVFFAPTDIQPGGLSNELQERLKASKNLIVICSPSSAKSKWVGAEIEYFYKLGRTSNIHFFIVDGQPNGDNPEIECFNPIVKTLGIPEILGANIHEKVYSFPFLNRERAYVQLITKLLGVEFDSIWQRHRRLLLRDVILCVLGVMLVVGALFGTWWMTRYVEVNIRVEEASVYNENLPIPKNVMLMLELENEVKSDILLNFDSTVVFTNIPQYFIGKNVRVVGSCDDFLPLDTTLCLSRDMILKLYRNPDVFGHVRFRFYSVDRKPLPNQELQVDGRTVLSDQDGYVIMDIPLTEQKLSYEVISNSLMADTITMPCGNSEGVFLKK